MDTKTVKRYMRLAIQEAKRGNDKTYPNPLVGCVIVKNNRVIGSGYHKRFGGPHAEIFALKEADKKADGATCFVTLEPCSYYGKTPPCVDALIRSGIKEVVCAAKDPNPLNNGKGLDALRRHSIKVSLGTLEKEAKALNRIFFKRMKSFKPLVTLKLAQSLDGKIASNCGDSKWISSKASRKVVQDLRKTHDAVLIGINTLLCDDPILTIRNSKRQPVKVIIDARLKTPLNARILKSISPGKTIIVTTKNADQGKAVALKSQGADILYAKSISKRVDLPALMKQLFLRGISSILAEGGGEISASLFKDSLIDKFYLFIAPIIIGGKAATNSIGGNGIDKIKDAKRFTDIKVKRVDNDILIEAKCSQA